MTQEQPKMGEKDKISECAETIRGIKDYESIIAVSAFKHKTTQEIQNALTFAIRVLERLEQNKLMVILAKQISYIHQSPTDETYICFKNDGSIVQAIIKGLMEE